MPRLSIIVDECGLGETRLDGNLLPNVVAVGFNADVGHPTEVTLVLAAVDVEMSSTIDLERIFVSRRKPL